MTRVPDNLHLNDPVAVNWDEETGNEDGFEGDTFDRVAAPIFGRAESVVVIEGMAYISLRFGNLSHCAPELT